MISIRATDYILRSSESIAGLFYICMESGFNSKLKAVQMEKKINTDLHGDIASFPDGWSKGDICVMITNKAKKTTCEYTMRDMKYSKMVEISQEKCIFQRN